MNTSKFSERLKELRLEKGFSQRDLAKATDLSQSSIAVWECTKSNPTANIIIALAIFFNVSSDYLLGLED